MEDKPKLILDEMDKIADKVYEEVCAAIDFAIADLGYPVVISWDGHIIIDKWHFYKGHTTFET
jgi:hypothetical protein